MSTSLSGALARVVGSLSDIDACRAALTELRRAGHAPLDVLERATTALLERALEFETEAFNWLNEVSKEDAHLWALQVEPRWFARLEALDDDEDRELATSRIDEALFGAEFMLDDMPGDFIADCARFAMLRGDLDKTIDLLERAANIEAFPLTEHHEAVVADRMRLRFWGLDTTGTSQDALIDYDAFIELCRDPGSLAFIDLIISQEAPRDALEVFFERNPPARPPERMSGAFNRLAPTHIPRHLAHAHAHARLGDTERAAAILRPLFAPDDEPSGLNTRVWLNDQSNWMTARAGGRAEAQLHALAAIGFGGELLVALGDARDEVRARFEPLANATRLLSGERAVDALDEPALSALGRVLERRLQLAALGRAGG